MDTFGFVIYYFNTIPTALYIHPTIIKDSKLYFKNSKSPKSRV